MELFAVNGYEGTSMAMIADKVGIKKPSLYAHYKNKEALFIDVTMAIADEYVEFVRKSLDVQTLNEKKVLYESFKTHIHDLARNDASIQFYNRFMQYPPKELEGELAACAGQSDEKAVTLLENVITKGQMSKEITEELDAKSIARTYFCLIDGLAGATTIHPLEEVERQAETIWEVFWRGIKT